MDDSITLMEQKPAYMAQYVTTLCCTIGGLAVGAVLGYSSPATPMLEQEGNLTDQSSNDHCQILGGEPLNKNQIAWFISIVNIGAIVGVVLGGFIISKFGRRGAMVASMLPCTIGWTLIAFASNFPMLVSGRAITGMFIGIVSIAVPTYIGEISSPEIRGFLASGFQLLMVTGVLYSYVLGTFLCWRWLAVAGLAPGVIFVLSMVFNKESPAHLISKDRIADARATLQYFRGKEYNIESELQQLQESINYARANKASLRSFMKPHVRRPLTIALSLMVLQQFAGVAAVLFNMNTIFEDVQMSIPADMSSVMVVSIQVIISGVAALLMDKAGRKLLLIISSTAMAIALSVMGTYFFLLDKQRAGNLGWLPLACVVVYFVTFSIGVGPTPWVLIGELFSADVKEVAGSLAILTLFLTAFIVTAIFTPLQEAIHDYGTFWLFSGVCLILLLFSVVVVPETKGKTTQEITLMFGGIPDADIQVNTETVDDSVPAIRRSGHEYSNTL